MCVFLFVYYYFKLFTIHSNFKWHKCYVFACMYSHFVSVYACYLCSNVTKWSKSFEFHKKIAYNIPFTLLLQRNWMTSCRNGIWRTVSRKLCFTGNEKLSLLDALSCDCYRCLLMSFCSIHRRDPLSNSSSKAGNAHVHVWYLRPWNRKSFLSFPSICVCFSIDAQKYSLEFFLLSLLLYSCTLSWHTFHIPCTWLFFANLRQKTC